MKYLTLFALSFVSWACSTPSGTALSPNAPADEYFYPPTNGVQYVYSQDNSVTSPTDTSTYQVVVGSSFDSYAKLVQKNSPVGNSGVLYYYKVDDGQAGIKCILSVTGSDQGIVALQGSLDIGSSWIADAAGIIRATVVGRYAEYFLPGRRQVYHDVIAVKYIDQTKNDSIYVLRFFARDYGLILEQIVTGPASEVSTLQLLDRLSAPNSVGGPGSRGHWYDERGRFIARWKDDPSDR